MIVLFLKNNFFLFFFNLFLFGLFSNLFVYSFFKISLYYHNTSRINVKYVKYDKDGKYTMYGLADRRIRKAEFNRR